MRGSPLRLQSISMVAWLPAIAMGLALGATAALGASVSYEYDDLGRLKAVVYDDGRRVDYVLDPAGNRESVATAVPVGGALRFSSGAYAVAENGASITITVERTGTGIGAIGVSYATANGTAAAGSDYTTSSGALSWADGDFAVKTFNVPIIDDGVYEGSETVTLTLNTPTGTGATLGTPASATLTINDNEIPPPGSLQLSASTYSVAENGGNLVVSVTRTGGSSGAASVNYATSNGTAAAASDYAATSGTLNWANGDAATKTFSVPILDDATVESSETFTVALSANTGASLGSPASATVTITDYEPGSVQLSASAYSIAENGGSLVVSVTRAGGSSGAASVNYATSNGTAAAASDYTATSGTLSWANGDAATKTFSVPILDDLSIESSETFGLTLSANTGAALGSPNSATATITDFEPGQLALSPVSYTVTEGGTTVAVSVTRTGGSNGAVGVTYAASAGTAAAGSDFTATNGTLSWANGDAATKTFSVTILDDLTVESAETINLALSAPTGGASVGASSGSITINDYEPGQLQFSASNYIVAENGSSVTITVQRVNGSNGAVGASYATTSGTAIAGSGGGGDFYTTSGSLTWPNADTANKTFTVSMVNDTTYEGSETGNLSLSAPTGGASLGTPSAATFTITEDDLGPWIMADSPQAVVEGGNIVFTVTKSSLTAVVHSVSYATSSGTATQGSDFTGTSGTLTFATNEFTKQVTVATSDDIALESLMETFTFTLSNPTNDARIIGDPGTGTIQDNESNIPSIPTNLRTNPVGIAFGGGFTVLWNASTGTVNHYTLHELITMGPGAGNTADYIVNAPTTSKGFTKGGTEKDFEYTVRACATADESQCSSWSSSVTISTCSAGGCN